MMMCTLSYCCSVYCQIALVLAAIAAPVRLFELPQRFMLTLVFLRPKTGLLAVVFVQVMLVLMAQEVVQALAQAIPTLVEIFPVNPKPYPYTLNPITLKP